MGAVLVPISWCGFVLLTPWGPFSVTSRDKADIQQPFLLFLASASPG